VTIDEKTVTVLQALRDEKRFIFEYDFGDSWEHDVMVEELTWSYFGLKYSGGAGWRERLSAGTTSAVPPLWLLPRGCR